MGKKKNVGKFEGKKFLLVIRESGYNINYNNIYISCNNRFLNGGVCDLVLFNYIYC